MTKNKTIIANRIDSSWNTFFVFIASVELSNKKKNETRWIRAKLISFKSMTSAGWFCFYQRMIHNKIVCTKVLLFNFKLTSSQIYGNFRRRFRVPVYIHKIDGIVCKLRKSRNKFEAKYFPVISHNIGNLPRLSSFHLFLRQSATIKSLNCYFFFLSFSLEGKWSKDKDKANRDEKKKMLKTFANEKTNKIYFLNKEE